MSLLRARPSILIGGVVLALSSLSAHAAIEADMRYENLQLTVTDASGLVTYPLLQAAGDPAWDLRHYMLHRAPEASADSLLSSPLPADETPVELSASTPTAHFQAIVAQDNDTLTLTQRFSTDPYSAGQTMRDVYSHLDTGLAPTSFVANMISGEGVDPFEIPVFGGIALAPGSQATLTGTMSLDGRLTFPDELADLSVYDALIDVDMLSVLMQVPEGSTLNNAMDVDAANFQITELNWEGKLQGSLAQNTPVADSRIKSFSMTVTNTSDVSTWLVVSTESSLSLNFHVQAAGNVPEPSTWALMGLGLVGISAVARRRQRARV